MMKAGILSLLALGVLAIVAAVVVMLEGSDADPEPLEDSRTGRESTDELGADGLL